MAEMFRRRQLPHYDVPGATYFVTSCLAGSIPAAGLLSIRRLREGMKRRAISPQSPRQEWKRRSASNLMMIGEEWLDVRPAVQWLANPQCAEIVARAIQHQAERHVRVDAYVVMPSHIHLVFTPLRPCHGRAKVMQSIKAYTSRLCKQVIGLEGAFWQAESYDRVVRNTDELQRMVAYVEWNPVKAGLCARPEEWRFSSAHDRAGALSPQE